MDEFEKITEDEFVRLVGVLGVENIGRNEHGTSWLLPDGRLAAEIRVGDRWEHLVSKDVM